MHQGEPLLLDEPVHDGRPVRKGVAPLDHAGPGGAGVPDLDERGVSGHDDRARHPQPRRVTRERLGVIARAGRDDALGERGGGEREELVERAPVLEGARALTELRLQMDALAHPFLERK